MSETVTTLTVVDSGDMTRDEKAAAYDRLRAVNAELLAALRLSVCQWEQFSMLNIYQQAAVDIARLVIAKAEEVTP